MWGNKIMVVVNSIAICLVVSEPPGIQLFPTTGVD
jgi:hypothetical protein